MNTEPNENIEVEAEIDENDLKDIIKDQIDKIDKENEGAKNFLKNLPQVSSTDVEKLEDRFKRIENGMDNIKKDFLIIFGLFASLVTFLSIEIQILRTINDFWLLLGFSNFLITIILLFSFTLNNIVKDRNELKDFWNPVSILIFVFIFITFIFFGIYFRIEILGFYRWYRSFVY